MHEIEPQTPPTQGMVVRAENVPDGANAMWNALTRAYGASAVYNIGSTSLNYFPSQEGARHFAAMIKDKMTTPIVRTHAPQTRESYDKMVHGLEHHPVQVDPEF